MKRIIATTAMTLMLSTSAFAAAHTTMLSPYVMEQPGDIYASDFIGMRVYAAETDFDSFNADTMVEAGAEQEWEDIGEINDVILGRDGSVKAVIIGVGGFIGIGEKDVAVEMSSIKMVNEKDDADDFFLVVNTNKESLTDFDAYSRTTAMEMKEEKAEVRAEATAETMMDNDREIFMAPRITRDGYGVATMEELTTEDLTGARIYDTKDEDIGEINSLIVDDSGQIKRAILDIGGFLGLGEHQISVTLDELSILRAADGSSFRVFIEATKEQLEAQPEYEG
ncbi:PRC-barrel domain-containing protein [Pararhizobium sp. IMCC21322]|uniref:PRC-barrel domain-containing protein n=1 Tax=Pararhizobium sp. IMCC21322 TaxID=3067903 RepID=UPI00274150F2|nr:PRC-barrel domain-containing protein [Pararhizobium sp. IMCC21322]